MFSGCKLLLLFRIADRRDHLTTGPAWKLLGSRCGRISTVIGSNHKSTPLSSHTDQRDDVQNIRRSVCTAGAIDHPLSNLRKDNLHAKNS